MRDAQDNPYVDTTTSQRQDTHYSDALGAVSCDFYSSVAGPSAEHSVNLEQPLNVASPK